MNFSERMEKILALYSERIENPPQSTYKHDIHALALGKYASLDQWEKIARANAEALVSQPVMIEQFDRIIGRVYHKNEQKPEAIAPDLDDKTEAQSRMDEIYEGYAELCEYQLATGGVPGHIAWDWNSLLLQGTEGFRRRCEDGLSRHAGDKKSEEFYCGVMIMLDALDEWNDLHVAELERLGMAEEAEICRRVPRYPARTFREALQCFFFQHIAVIKENTFGGNSPGRLDYYLWTYLEADLAAGRCTLDEARELIEELFLRIDERIYWAHGWGETVVVGGTAPDGKSAVNPLSYIMIETVMKYDIAHPWVYARLTKDPPADFVDLCADYVANGGNRAQIINDEAVMSALMRNGVTYADAADYFCGGCMEVGVQGKTSDFLFTGFHNIPMLLELCITGGYCLTNKKQLGHFSARPLTEFESFEDFYAQFIEKARLTMHANLAYQDMLSEYSEKARPSYLLSSMIDDCLDRGRNMHGGGARYHDYGASFIGIPNAADSLYAIRRAVFEDNLCTARELTDALAADFEGYEELRRRLVALPKFGQENEEADAMMARLSADLSNIYASYTNRFGGNGKPVILSFVWAPVAGKLLGATPDGRHAGVPVAQAVTPQGMAMTEGITAAMNSCAKLPFELFTGGATTMWDLDHTAVSVPLVRALLLSFFAQGGQFFQGNVTDVQDLIEAQRDPENHRSLVVRVGGYSARFIQLKPELQNEIINRYRHKT